MFTYIRNQGSVSCEADRDQDSGVAKRARIVMRL